MSIQAEVRPAVTAVQGRWGWYACDHATFLLYKKLAAHVRKAQAQYCTWLRWNRKQPQNRVLRRHVRDTQGRKCGREVVGPWAEPPLSPVFVTRSMVRDSWESYVQKKEVLKEVVVFNPHGAIEAYRQARYPKATPEAVRPLALSVDQVKALLAQLGE